MKKVVKSRKNKVALLLVLSSLLTGCNLEDNITLTDVDYKHETVYSNEENGCVKFEDLKDYYFYVIKEENENGTIKFTKLLKSIDDDNYSLYINGVTGSIYNLNINNPTKRDMMEYKTLLQNKDMYLVESLLEEIDERKYSEYIRDGVNETSITKEALALLIASYYPNNIEEIEKIIK